KMEHVNKLSDIQHPAAREVLKFLKIKQGVEIHHDGDLPARTGLGSSSAFTVGLLHAFYALKGEMPTKDRLAREAIYIEREMCKEYVGCQDQIMCANGGMNLVEFKGEDEFDIREVTLKKEIIQNLQSHLMLYFTGFSRFASEIALHQIQNMENRNVEMERMREMVFEGLGHLQGNDMKSFGKLLDEGWKIKRTLSDKISSTHIDHIYSTARKAGAWGGKLLGAGGGGFMILFVPPHKQKAVKEHLKKLLLVPVKIENMGTRIIFYQEENGYKV
ncbi:MAG: kinase, partial [Candidatus Omnitrophica bacterium]|nr:kinase [Candidatus Omnitrophota bacterium]